MAGETALKWKLPGWRIESRYNNNVLLGNWDEERRKVSYHNLFAVNLIMIFKYSVFIFHLV